MFLVGSCLVGFSLPVAIYMFSMLHKVTSNPYIYRFTNGFTKESMAAIGIHAVMVGVIGLCLMFIGYIKRRNSAALSAIVNYAKEKVCPQCRVNVASEDGECPICGERVKER